MIWGLSVCDVNIFLDVSAGPRKRNALNLYKDPRADSRSLTLASPPSNSLIPAHEAEDLSLDSGSDTGDVAALRQQHRSLGKRPQRTSELDALFDEYTSDPEPVRHRSSFRPSDVQQQVHRAIAHPQLKGKDPQYLLESLQQSVHVQFLASPPILRGLYDFSFGNRGLSVMHCRPVDTLDRVNALESTSSSTDFSEKNQLRPAAPATSRLDVLEALRSLRVLAAAFYSPVVCALIDAASHFHSRYKGIPDNDAFGWKRLAYWVTTKFCAFRSHIVAKEVSEAAAVCHQFSRNDEELLELHDLRANQRPAATPSHRARPAIDTGRRPSDHVAQPPANRRKYYQPSRCKAALETVKVVALSARGHTFAHLSFQTS
ncbi:hypothetical protein PHMEG_00019494 [Phytophthora megakarya]|uniref:Uncharacterized protein n=1 Tax=Phytophthora megakarya TaxID=4795 RepID=A0A225VS90_9STRA|nr:hypothetical protein PHMEG_00019494 [Phytophthora megakarya]